MWTFLNRREWIDSQRWQCALLKADDTYHKWEEAPELHNENWDYYNYSKNKLLLESLLCKYRC